MLVKGVLVIFQKHRGNHGIFGCSIINETTRRTWVNESCETWSTYDIVTATWWHHQMETFSALLAICAGNSPVPVNSPHTGQWLGSLMFSLIYAWISDWVNSREAGDLRRHRGHYDVIVMKTHTSPLYVHSYQVHLSLFRRHHRSCVCALAYPCGVVNVTSSVYETWEEVLWW